MATKKTYPLRLNLCKELYVSSGSYFIGLLSPKSKYLLTLPEENRIGSAFSDLLSEMENINVFAMFRNRSKEFLAKKLKFVTHKADETLLEHGEQDNPPQALYIILSGVVTEHYKPLVTDAESPVVWPETVLRNGEFFGHVDIVYNRPPTVDARTVGYSELLMLPKEDFRFVRKEMEAYCTRTAHYLRTTGAINRFGWSDEEYKVLEIYSKFQSYVKDQVIYSGVQNNKPFWSYFVVLGECKIARELMYYVTDSGFMKAVPYQLRKELKVDKILTDRIEFAEVKQGYYFGVGERFIDNHVIACSNLECLLIPRLLFVFKNRELLKNMAKGLTDNLPSNQEVLDSYSKSVSVDKKKVKMVKDKRVC